MFINDVTVTSL